EVAVRLLARIDCHVAPEAVERLLADAEGAPVARRADHTRAGELLHRAREGGIHLIRRHHLVADEASVGARTLDAQLRHHRLARDARADVALKAQVGRAGD